MPRRLTQLLSFLLLLLLPLALIHAQEEDQNDRPGSNGDSGEFSEGFGGDFGSGFAESSSGDDGAASGGNDAGGENGSGGDADSGAGGFGSGFGTSGPSLDWGGMLRFDTRVTADYDNPAKSSVSSEPEFHLDLEYTNNNSEIVTNLEFRPEYLQGSEDAREFAEELVDEAYLTLFYDSFNVQAGYLREVWGTGDQVHVMDVLNSNDLRDFVNPDYAERRLSRPMFKLNVPVRVQGRLEVVYLPTFEGDLIPQGGAWAPAEVEELRALIEEDRVAAAATAPGLTLGEAEVLESSVVRPETSTLEWGQYATRYRDTFGSVDLGVVYYHGFLKQPSVEYVTDTVPDTVAEHTLSERLDLHQGDRILFDYDRVNVFGLEYAAVIGGFNTRAEAAYYLTEDVDGDDPTVTNNSLQYLAGFDRDLPLSNLNINIQGTGTYYLGTEEIEENVEEQMDYDFQYDEDGEYTSHVVSAALTDSYANETIKPEVAVSYGVENEDWYINPSIEFTLLDDVKLFTEVAVFHGDEGYFGQYDENDFAEVRLEYSY